MLQRRLPVDRPRRADRPRASAATTLDALRRHRVGDRPGASRSCSSCSTRSRPSTGAASTRSTQTLEAVAAARHAGARLLAERRRRLRGRREGHPACSASPAGATASTSSATCRRRTFVRLMAHCACMVGNSSAALREGAFLGTPAVTVGTRQQGRERGTNVVDVEHDAARDRRRDPRPARARALRARACSSATATPARRSPTSSRGRSPPCRSDCCSRPRPCLRALERALERGGGRAREAVTVLRQVDPVAGRLFRVVGDVREIREDPRLARAEPPQWKPLVSQRMIVPAGPVIVGRSS